jgi:hypothetical protein
MSLSATKLNEFLAWRWESERAPQPLHLAGALHNAHGIYELGLMQAAAVAEEGDAQATPAARVFVPQYVGRAAGIGLRERLLQHWHASHNSRVRAHAHQLWFRYHVMHDTSSASSVGAYLEAIGNVALDYPFNRRNEWRQHWALET